MPSHSNSDVLKPSAKEQSLNRQNETLLIVLKFLAMTGAGLALLLGVTVIFGWHTNNTSLIQVNEAFVPMQYNTALCFVLCGLALLLCSASELRNHSRHRAKSSESNRPTTVKFISQRLVVGSLAALALLIGFGTLLQYLFNVELYIDQLFMEHYIVHKTSHPGRMAPNTALCFSLTGAALLLISCFELKPWVLAWAARLAALIFSLGVVASTGYMVGIESAYGWGKLTMMAVHTSAGFMLLGLGTFSFIFCCHFNRISALIPNWLHWPILIAGFAITGSFWWANEARENLLEGVLGGSAHSLAGINLILFGTIATLSLVAYIKQQTGSGLQEWLPSRQFGPWLVVLMGAILSFALLQVLHGNFKANVKQRFEHAAETHGKSLQQGFLPYVEALYHIRTAYNASNFVTQTEFKVFTERDLKRLPGMLSLQWAPLVKHEQRNEFERMVNEELLLHYGEGVIPPYSIKELNQADHGAPSVTSPNRDSYFPVLYLEPFAKNIAALGFDLATNPPGISELLKSAETNSLVASERIELVQKERKRAGVILTLPVYDSAANTSTPEQRLDALHGLATAVFDIGSMIEVILDHTTEPSALHLRFEDLDGEGESRALYQHVSRLSESLYDGLDLDADEVEPSYQVTVPLTFGNRQWQMIVTPASSALYPTWSMIVAYVPSFIMIFSLGLAFYLRQSDNRERERATLLKELASRERHFSALVNTIPGTVYSCMHDDKWTMLFINKEVEKLTGYLPEDFIARGTLDLVDLIHPDDVQLVSDAVNTAVTDGNDYTIEYRLYDKDGKLRWVLERGQAVFNRFGRAEVLHGTILDITYRKHSEDQFRGLLESAPDGMVIIDESGTIVFVNKQTELMFGYEREELLNQAVEILLPNRLQHSHPPLRQGYFESPKVRRMGAGKKLTARHKDGSELPVEISLSPMQSDKGLLVSAAIRDISEREKMEGELLSAKEKAEEATQAKSDFLANMSHEIRTPMNSIIGMSRLVLETELTDEQRNYIDKVNRSAELLLGIINDILDFSKIEAGKLELERAPFRLDWVFENLANMIGLKAEDKGLELLFDFSNDVPNFLIGDALRLGQVLVNLGNNAIKFTEQGEVLISVNCVKSDDTTAELRFSVKDDGIGMSADQQDKLFESFTQADSSITREYGGTGLGLAISKELTELMQGRISVESELNKGSCFSFSARFELDTSQSKAEYPVGDSLEALKVLVVDDSTTSITIICRMLENFGFDVTSCKSGDEAIELVRLAESNIPYQLVVMDWKLTDIDGIETTRRLQDDPQVVTMPTCIMVTASAREDAIKAAEGVDIKGFLTKPLNPSSLLDAIMTAMGRNEWIINRSNAKDRDSSHWAGKLRGAKILLVEDNEFNQELAVAILKNNGMDVVVANHGKEALKLLAGLEFDGVLMDCQMPIMDGYTATQKIREQRQFAALPVLALTANAMAGDREKVIAAGMNDHIAKPIDPNQMLKTMAQWITPAAKTGIGAIAGGPVTATTDDSDKVLASAIQQLRPEFDVTAGLARCEQDVRLYSRLLMRFINSHSDFITEYEATLSNGDAEASKRCAHTLKGVAANAGIVSITEAARAVEVSCEKEGANSESTRTKVKEVQHYLDQLKPKLTRFSDQFDALQQPVIAVGQQVLFDSETLNKQLNEFASQLQDYDTAATEQLKQLQLQPGPAGYEQALAKIAGCLDRFDFEGALEHLEAFQQIQS